MESAAFAAGFAAMKPKEIQCGATFRHALAHTSPSRMRPPVACVIGEFS